MTNGASIIRQEKIDEATITLKSDGIIYVLFHEDITLDVKLQMLMLNLYKQIAQDKKYPFIFEALEGVTVTKEARDNAIRIESESPGIAFAVVADSLPYRLIANFYMKVNKPKLPYQVFKNREDALVWLKTFVK